MMGLKVAGNRTTFAVKVTSAVIRNESVLVAAVACLSLLVNRFLQVLLSLIEADLLHDDCTSSECDTGI